MNENFRDGDEFIPGALNDFSDAVAAGGRTRSAPSSPPPSSAPAPTSASPSVAPGWTPPNPGADGITPSGGVELADIGQADQAGTTKPIACDPSALRRTILDTLGMEVMRAMEAERIYAEMVVESGDMAGPVHAIARIQRRTSEAETIGQVREGLLELAILGASGPFATGTIYSLLRRQWHTTVYPAAKALAAAFREKLAEWRASLQVEKAKLEKQFGHLGIKPMTESDAVLEALEREVAHFDGALSSILNNSRYTTNCPMRDVVRNFTNR